jgi:putative addiction module component (TIGR02574 family)
MNLETVSEEALHLSVGERASLVQRLLDSLDALPPAELEQLWLDEAAQRARAIDAGLVQLVPADEVLRRARALLK